MNPDKKTYLLEIYEHCKDLDFFYSHRDFQKVFEEEYKIIKEFIPINNLFCNLINANEIADNYYSAKPINQEILQQYFQLFCEENFYKTFIIADQYILILPLIDDNIIIGHYAFAKDTDWSDNDIGFIRIICHLFLLFFSHKLEYQELLFKKSILLQLLDTINGNICLTDPETDEILFMNQNMKEEYHADNFTEKKCWEVLYPNQQQRCAHCPIDYLKQHPLETYTYEHVQNTQGKHYLNHDCMIEWSDHRQVHFLHSVDITELKQIQKDASFDDLTNIYNRKAGKNALKKLLLQAKNNHKNVIVCLYDTDNLKYVNDCFGHIEGDNMLRTIADEVKNTTSSQDVFFRLSGDEFIIAYYDASKDEIKQKIVNVLHNLKKIAVNERLRYQLSFCYGVYEVTPDTPLSLNEIIIATDEEMYLQKKKSHLRTSVYKYNNSSSIAESFDYNTDLLYDALVKSSDDYMFICDLKTNTYRYPPEFVEEFDFPGEILTNASMVMSSKIHKDDKYEYLNENQLVLDGRSDSHIIEYRALNKHNEWVWLRCRGNVAYDENGIPSIFAGFISNLGKKNYRDALTGLYNKFEFEKRINEIVGHFSVIILNVNGFAKLNQLYDRDFGDQALRIIGQNLQTLLHKDTTVFKLDGDEFAFILKETSPKNIQDLFNKIQSFASHSHTYEGKNYTYSFTGGAAISPKDGTSYLTLRKCCGTALNYGKIFNRSHLTFFTSSLLEKETYSLQLLSSLQQDIHNQFTHFHLVYQPKVATLTHQLVGFEALCRWNNPDFPNIGPGTFIPILESSNDIIALGEWIFEQSVQQLKQWLPLHPQLTISINVSYIQLTEIDFIPFIQSVIEHYEVPFENVIIELTETAITKNIQLILDAILRIRQLGIKIAMDDFGKGYSSLSLLKEEPLDIIKIDQSFVKDIQNDSFNSALIKFIIELCHQIDLTVIIEGIESQEELEVIEAFKPDYIQGYYTGKPMGTKQCLDFIQENIDK